MRVKRFDDKANVVVMANENDLGTPDTSFGTVGELGIWSVASRQERAMQANDTVVD